MKWFKKATNFYQDNRTIECLSILGTDGVVLYDMLLCIMAEQWDGKPNKIFTIHPKKLQSFHIKSGKKLEKVWQKLAEIYQFSYQKSGENFQVFYPKFMNWQSSYFRGVLTKTHSVQQYKNRIEENRIDNIIYTPFQEIIDYLNKKANKNFKSDSPKTRKFITSRINQGFTLIDFQKVIDNKMKDKYFIENPQYLRPETLFGTKFEAYLNEGGISGYQLDESDKIEEMIKRSRDLKKDKEVVNE